MPKTEVIHERFPYRYVRKGTIELNGKPDYRIQKMNEWSRQYNDCLTYCSDGNSSSRIPHEIL